jgi:hypothetical protein
MAGRFSTLRSSVLDAVQSRIAAPVEEPLANLPVVETAPETVPESAPIVMPSPPPAAPPVNPLHSDKYLDAN